MIFNKANPSATARPEANGPLDATRLLLLAWKLHPAAFLVVLLRTVMQRG